MLVDSLKGILIYGYDGKLVSSPKLPGLRTEFLNEKLVTISHDTIAIRDISDEKAVYLFDVLTGKPIGEQPFFRHSREITQIALDHSLDSATNSRQLAIVDKNQDLYLLSGLYASKGAAGGKSSTATTGAKKLASMTDSLKWNEEAQILSAIIDGKISIWYYPSASFIDPDIAEMTRATIDTAASVRQGNILLFVRSQCLVRASDGSVLNVHGIDPFPMVLNRVLTRGKQGDSVKLCRVVKVIH